MDPQVPDGLPSWLNLAIQITLLVIAIVSGAFGQWLFGWWRAKRTEDRDDKRLDHEQKQSEKRLEHEQQLTEANLAFTIYKDVIQTLQTENSKLKEEIASLRKELNEVKDKLYKIESCPTVQTQLNGK